MVYTSITLIGLLSYAILSIQVGLNIISVSTFMFEEVSIIELSFFNTTSGMHRRPFEGRHLVLFYIASINFFIFNFQSENLFCDTSTLLAVTLWITLWAPVPDALLRSLQN